MNISKDKKGIPIKLFKVFLLYLLVLFVKKGSQYITLIADSYYGQTYKNSNKKGREFRLACYYQQLGFEPINKEQFIKHLYECKHNMSQKEYKDLKSMCILDKCQEQILLKKFDINLRFDILKVEMSLLIPNILIKLKDVLRDMKCK